MKLTYKNLIIEIPYEAIYVKDINITLSLNDHGYLYLKLLVAEDKISDYLNKESKDEKVAIYKTSGDNSSKFFTGKIQKLRMSFEGGLHYVEIKCVSFTKDFDIKRKCRAFTDTSMTYLDLIYKVLNEYDKVGFTDNATEGTALEEFVLQYEETDWEFLRRIASWFNTVLLCDATEDIGRFHFGIPEITNDVDLSIDDYEVIKDIDAYKEQESYDAEDNFLQEYIRWDIICDRRMGLGENVTFNEIKCVVIKITNKIINEEFKTIYTLGIPRGVRTIYKANHRIFGMSLPATIEEVRGNTIRVTFKNMENINGGKDKYFTYSLESSSWYCMPEVGSDVHIYLPSNYEGDAIAVHALRQSGKGLDSSIKSFSHKEGSIMQLTPGNISFSSDKDGASAIEFSSSGVKLNCDELALISEGDLNLGLRDSKDDEPALKPESIIISAGEDFVISRADSSQIIMSDFLAMQAEKIKYEGGSKGTVPMSEEVKHRNDDDDKIIEEINGAAEEIHEQKLEEAKGKVKKGLFAVFAGVAAITAAVVVTVATGGIGAPLAIGIAVAAITSIGYGASNLAEGISDQKKITNGDYSQSYNFMRDTIFNGNQTAYDLVGNGAVLVSSILFGVLTGTVAAGAGMALMGVGISTKIQLDADYADDGKINNDISSYLNSSMEIASGAFIAGGMDKVKGIGLSKLKASKPVQKLIEKYRAWRCDPVDAATGSLYIPSTDIVLPDIHEEFVIERKYESVYSRVGILGMNWTVNIESNIEIEEDNAYVLCTDGHTEIFNKINSMWINNAGGTESYTLKEENGLYIFKSFQDKKTFIYNSVGNLIKIIDRCGNELNITYVDKNIETITTFSNYKLFFTYKDNKIIQIKDELGRCVQYKYDGDYLTEVVHLNQGITRYTYDENGYINSITDKNGYTYTKNFFDEKGRIVRQEYPGGDTDDVIYNDSEKEIKFNYNGSNRSERIRHNAEGLITHVFYEDGSTEEYGYDKYQNRNYEKDRNGNTTRKEFNIYGSIIKEELPDGLIKEYEYDENQNLIKFTDNEGREVLYTYDERNNLLEEKRKISVGRWKTESFTYDAFGRALTKTDANGNTTRYEYDLGDNLEGKIGKDPVKVITNSGYEYEYTYDNVGRNTEIKTDYGTIEFGYNNLDYVAKIKDANGNVTKKSYDKMGNLIRVDTPNGIINDEVDGEGFHYEYDHMDKLMTIKDPLGIVHQSLRDSEGNIIKEVNPNYYDILSKNGKGIEFVYDKDNRKIKTICADGGIERLFYDANGNVIKKISPEYYNAEIDDGLGVCYTYDSLNRIKEVINEDSKTEIIFEYDLNGNIIKAIDIEGFATLYKYDLVGNLIEKKSPVELVDGETKYNVVYYEYDNNGNKILEKYGLDLVKEDELSYRFNEISFKYDKENRLIEVCDKYGAKARYRYDCLNHKTFESFKINDDTTKVVHYIYDKVGNLVERKEEINGKFISPDNDRNVFSITKYEYDKNGNVTKIISPNGFIRGRVYDEIDRVIEEHEVDEENGIFRSMVYEYDKADNIISIREFSGEDAKAITKKYESEYDYNAKFFDRYNKKKENDKLFKEKNFDFDKKKKSFKYDEQNRLTHFINFSGNTTRLFYDKNDRIIKEVLPEQYDAAIDDGMGTTYKYNVTGQVLEVKNALDHVVTKNTYDPRRNLKSSIDGENNKVEYTYTLLGQIKDITTPNSRKENKKVQSYSYDVRGNITGIVDGNGNETSYLLDDWGRIIQITTPEGGVEKYTYDYAGNITSTTDANGGKIQYFYNSLGQVSEIKDQEGNSEYFYYDKEGNLTKRIDRNGNNHDRSYNIDGNITLLEAYKKDKENKLNVVRQQLEYNPDGTISSAVFGNMYYNYDYNIEGLLKKKSASGKTLLEYTYDKNNNIKTIQDITGKYSKYTYDKADRLKTIQDEKDEIQAQYEYFGNYDIKSVTLGNGVKTEYSYDGDGNVASLVTVTLDGEVLVDYNYAYDLNGNRLKKVSSKHKNFFSYDSMNRLTDCSYDIRKESFTYDKVGNRLTKVTNDITEKYIYNVKNQLKELHHKDGRSFFTYDKQGNTLKEETTTGVNSFEYNTLNQQVKAITKDGNTLINRYDAEGLRYEIEENEKLSKFIFNKNGDTLVELNEDNKVVSRFTRGYEIVAADVKDNRYYYSVNEQGSTEFIIDIAGKVRNEYRYDAFGYILEAKEDIHNRITYTGQQFDGVTNQYYLRARFYNPVIGRFTQEDSYRGDGLNLYAYCGNNPVVYYDPSGYMKGSVTTTKNDDFLSAYNTGKANKVAFNDDPNLPVNIIEIERNDIKQFVKHPPSGKNTVVIDLKIDGATALAKNKTGELGLLNEHMIEQNIVLNKMSTKHKDILQANKDFALQKYLGQPASSDSHRMVGGFRKKAGKQLGNRKITVVGGATRVGQAPHALDTCFAGPANMFLNGYRAPYANGTLGALLSNHTNEIQPGKKHLLRLVVDRRDPKTGKMQTITLNQYLKENNQTLDKQLCKYKCPTK